MVPELHTSSTTNYPNGARIAYVALASAQPHAAPPFTQLATGARTSVEPLAAVGRAAMAAERAGALGVRIIKGELLQGLDVARGEEGDARQRKGESIGPHAVLAQVGST